MVVEEEEVEEEPLLSLIPWCCNATYCILYVGEGQSSRGRFGTQRPGVHRTQGFMGRRVSEAGLILASDSHCPLTQPSQSLDAVMANRQLRTFNILRIMRPCRTAGACCRTSWLSYEVNL